MNVSVLKMLRPGRLPVSLQSGIGFRAAAQAPGVQAARYHLRAGIVLPQ